MQKFKKTLAILLSLVMLFCVLPINTFAAETSNLSITNNQVINLSFDENNPQYQLAFTPTETGLYKFHSFNNGSAESHLDTYGFVYYSNGVELSRNDDGGGESNFEILFWATANQTYYLNATTYSYQAYKEYSNGNCGISVTKTTENISTLALDQTFTDVVNGYGYNYFVFTPKASAVYDFIYTYNSENLHAYIDTVFDNNNSSEPSHYYYIEGEYPFQKVHEQYSLKKDTTYCLKFGYDGSSSYTIEVKKPVKATSLSFEETNLTEYVGTYAYNYITFSPDGSAFEEVSYSVADPSIAEITDYSNHHICLRMLKGGTTTVTARSDSGFTDTCTVTAIEPEELSIGSSKSGTLTYEDYVRVYKFIPQEDGLYNFNLSGADLYLSIFDNYDNALFWNMGASIIAQLTLEKGETYYLSFSPTWAEPYEGYVGNYTLAVNKAVPATSLEIVCDTEEITPQSYINLTPIFKPNGAIVEDINWEIDNTDVVYITNDYYDESIELFCQRPGTATVTATSESGLTATYIINVEGYEKLYLDTPFTHTGADYESKYYEFTPSQTAVYQINFDVPTYPHSYCQITDEDSNPPKHMCSWRDYSDGEGNKVEKSQYILEKDKTYYINTYISSAATYTLNITKPQKAEYMTLSQTNINGFIDSTYSISASFGPKDTAYENVTWSISDESVAKISHDTNYDNTRYLNVTILKSGTATITATSDSGLTATCTVNVVPTEEISVNTTKHGALTWEDDTVTYKFVPQKDGAYMFSLNDSNNSDNYFYLFVRNKYGHAWLSSDGTFIEEQVILRKGETYYLEISCDTVAESDDIGADYFITISIPPKATSLTISGDNKSIYPGEEISLYPQFNPSNSAIENVEWSVEDSDIAYIDYYFDEVGVALYASKAGTTTVTATSESGLTASYTLTVKSYNDAPELKLNEKNPVSINNDTAVFKFTPTESGTYAFYSTGRVDTSCHLLDSNLNHLIDNGWSGYDNNFYLTYTLNAGETYYIKSYLHGVYGETITTYNIWVKKLVPATSVKILNGSIYEGYACSHVSLYAKLNPDNAIKEELSWTVEDENIANIEGYNNDGISLFLNNVGTTTVTVTTESGLTDSIEIIVKEEKPESIKISAGTHIKMYEFQSRTLYVDFNPNIYSEEVYWSSSDPDVVSIGWQGYTECEIHSMKSGTATITATTKSGLTASCVVTVLAEEKIELNETKKVTITNPNSSVKFQFTPAESGYYTFYSISPYDTKCHIYEINYSDDCGANKNFRVSGYMHAGSTYTLESWFYNENTIGEFDVRLERLDLETINGDINFDNQVNSLDLAWMRKLMLDLIPTDSASRDIYDVNTDNSLDVRDLVRLKSLVANN